MLFTRFLFPITLLIGFSTVHGQKNVTDSLVKVWNNLTLPDTVRLDAADFLAQKVYFKSNPDSSRYYSDQIYELAKSINNSNYEIRALNNKAELYKISAKFEKSDSIFRRALSIAEKNNNTKYIANITLNIGSLHRERGDFQTAVDYLNKALKISREINDSTTIGTIHDQLGTVYSSLGMYNKALTSFNNSLDIRIEMNDRANMVSVYNALGIVHYKKENYPKAIENYTKAMEIAQEFNDLQRLAGLYGNLGIIYKNVGDYDQSIIYTKKALEIFEKFDFKRGIAGLNGNLALIYKRQNKFTKSLQSHQKCLAIMEEIGNAKGIADSHDNLGTIYSYLGDSAAINRQDSLVKFYEEKAIEHYNKSNEIRKEIGDLEGLNTSNINQISVLRDQGKYEAAIEIGEKAIEGAKQLEIPAHLTSSYAILFRTALYADRMDLANRYINNLIDLRKKNLITNFPILSEKDKEGYFKDMWIDFNNFYDFARIDGEAKPELKSRAYNIALLTKGLLLKSSTAMRKAIYESKDTTLINDFENWIDLKKELAKRYASGGKTDSLEQVANKIEKDLVKESHEFSAVRRTQNIKWTEVQDSLKRNEAAIEFIRFVHQPHPRRDTGIHNYYAALIIRKDFKYPEMVLLCEEHELEKIIGDFPGNNQSYINQIYGTKKNSKTQLYELIWKPLEQHLSGTEHVYISPDGLLYKISFAALAKNQNILLCDTYQIENKTSTVKIALPDKIAYNEGATTTLFGGIQYNTDSTHNEIWNYLHGSKTETEQIEKVLYKKDYTVHSYYLANATEEQFKDKASHSDILHIATHGFFYHDPEITLEETVDESETDITFRGGRTGFGVETFVKNKNPLMRSGLVFAGANDVWSKTQSKTEQEDGVLTAAEVATIDMRQTDLVVLSACETGLGDIKGSEGVYGLQRSFKMAGVKYLIMSLWQVPDKETAEFMTTFYKHLTKTNDIRKAFNLTQQSMRKKYDPYYWGAFILIE